MVKPVGEWLLVTTGYSLSLKDHKLVLAARGKGVCTMGRAGEHLNQVVKHPSSTKGPSEVRPLF